MLGHSGASKTFLFTIGIFSILMLSIASFGQAIPSSYFGMHVRKTSTPWPTAQFGSLRLWDDGVAWASINTSRGTYNWSTMDTWVKAAQQHNAALTYTFGRTPQWASSNPGLSSCDYGPGQCVAPANYTDWDNFVTQLVTRYKGQIHSYELWNEPNDSGFWQGTTAEMVELSRRASGIIRSIDPNAQILSPAATWKSVTAWQWLDSYFTAGGAAYIDVVSFHGYTGNGKAESVFSIIDNIQKTLNLHGVSMPMVISEGGWGLNTVVSNPDAQAAFLAQRYLLIQTRPAVQSFFWYMWDDSSWGTLWDSSKGVHKAGIAYQEVSKWLTGANRNGCTQASDSTWTCSFTRANGYQSLAVWNAVATKSYTPAAQYVTYRAIDGAVSQIAGGSSVTISNKPILFETGSSPALSANLSVTPNTGILPLNVTANVTATTDPSATITSTMIDFGNGTVVNGNTGSAQYSAAGTYTVIATVKDSLGRTTTKNVAVTASVNQPPLAALSVSPAHGPAPLSVSASTANSTDPDGKIASSSIDFGDGTVLNGSIASHVYPNPGSYTARATVTDNLGATSQASVTVTATNGNQPPVAKLTTTQTAPMSVKASTAGSYDPDGTIAATTINWGDGSISNGVSASHTYSKPGTYIVIASVTDNLGMISTAATTATPRLGVMFTSPTNTTSATSPVHIVALAASNAHIQTMKLYVDGVSKYTSTSWLLDTYVALAAGTRQVLVQAWDSNGVTYKAAISITVH